MDSARRRFISSRLALAFVGIIGVACALYLTFRADSDLHSVPYMPRALGDWLERNGRFRNFPAYAMLAVPYLLLFRTLRRRALAMLLLAIFGSALEALQYFLPSRWCEWQDAALSVAGVAAAWVAFALARLAFGRSAQSGASPGSKAEAAVRRLQASISRP